MDPVTQGLLGATAAQAVLGPRGGARVWLAGLGGGLLPDADFLLQPFSDPALPWEYHRHFSHAILLAPVLGLLAAGLLLAIPWFRRRAGPVLAGGVIGALTHGPLDWCTSYGTKILWPFSHADATLDLFPIVDPLLTLVLLAALVAAALRTARAPAVLALAFVALYAGAAWMQREAAHDAQAALVARRGHAPTHRRVMPLPGSLLVWRSLYVADDRLVADLLRPDPFGETRAIGGGSLPRVTLADVLSGAREPERVASVFRRFARFADGFTARVPGAPDRIGDMRFSVEPGFDPPWALALGRSPRDPPVAWVMRRFDGATIGRLWRTILGTSDALRPLRELR